MAFEERYNVPPFDPNDPRDVMSDTARRIMIRAFQEAMHTVDAQSGEDLQDIMGGLLLGLVCVMSAHMETTDQSHAAIRSSLIRLAPWAVDMMRSFDDLPPLAEA